VILQLVPQTELRISQFRVLVLSIFNLLHTKVQVHVIRKEILIREISLFRKQSPKKLNLDQALTRYFSYKSNMNTTQVRVRKGKKSNIRVPNK